MELHKTSLLTLHNLLRNAIEYGDSQVLINMYAKEITDRLYIPNNQEQTYEEMLASFGYKEIKVLKKVR